MSLRVVLVALALAPSVGCSWARDLMGMGPRTPAGGGGPIKPVNANDLVAYVNSHADRLQSVSYGDVSVSTREGVLLKTLGATRRQIGRILLSEYALLGVLGAATGMVLAIGGAWAIMRWVFERPFEPALAAAASIALAMLVLAVSIGLLSGRDVFKETAMTALREV